MATKTSKAQGSKATAKSTEGKKPNALQKQLQPSKQLATAVGAERMPEARSEQRVGVARLRGIVAGDQRREGRHAHERDQERAAGGGAPVARQAPEGLDAGALAGPGRLERSIGHRHGYVALRSSRIGGSSQPYERSTRMFAST